MPAVENRELSPKVHLVQVHVSSKDMSLQGHAYEGQIPVRGKTGDQIISLLR